ncbi:MAG: cell wall-active antibiotics response protein [Gemmatimonadota bacterium]|nr:cell wall-active antibiotics response protein [Gemmatimonadota bacterium]
MARDTVARQPFGPSFEEARSAVIRQLGAYYAADRMPIDELERRIELAQRATASAELHALVADIPGGEIAPVRERQDLIVSTDEVPRRKAIVAIMGGVSRRGTWTVPQRCWAVALMGAIELDLREARLSPGTTNIRAFAMMGAVVVYVPPGVRVETDGLAIMGGFEDQLHQPASGNQDAPLIRVTGLALMGGVEVRVLLPGEPIPEDDD